MSDPKTKELISVKEAAAALNWKIPKVLRNIKSGKIKAEKVGAWTWVVFRSSIDSIIQQNGPTDA